MLHTKYISCGPHGFREEDFLDFSHFKSMEANDPRQRANLDPRGMVGRVYVADHQTSLHTLSVSSGLHGFKEDFLMFFSYIALYKHMIDPLWCGQFGA